MTRQLHEADRTSTETHHESTFRHSVSITHTGRVRYQEMYPAATKPEIAHAIEAAELLSHEEASALLDHLEVGGEADYYLHAERTGVLVCRPHRTTGVPTLVTFVAFRSHRMRTRAIQLHGDGEPPTCAHTWPDRTQPGSRLLFGVPATLVRPSTGLRRHLEGRSIAGTLLDVDWQPGSGPTPPEWLDKHGAVEPWAETVWHGQLDGRPVALLQRGGGLWASLTPAPLTPGARTPPLQPPETVEQVIPWLGVRAKDVVIHSAVLEDHGRARYGHPPTNGHQRKRLRWDLRVQLLRMPAPPSEGDALRPTLAGQTLWLTQQQRPERAWWLTTTAPYTPAAHENAMADALIARGWRVVPPLHDPEEVTRER